MRTLMMVATFIFSAAYAEAHDIYSGLKDRRTQVDCCHETDCRAANYRVTPAGVEMLLDDEWVRVPNEVIQYRALYGDTGETRGGHWCGIMYRGFEPALPDYPAMSPSQFITRCVVLPPGLF